MAAEGVKQDTKRFWGLEEHEISNLINYFATKNGVCLQQQGQSEKGMGSKMVWLCPAVLQLNAGDKCGLELESRSESP